MPEISYTPGVYVKEVQTGARPIQAVGTSTAGFVGVAPWKTARVGEAYSITNWNQFNDQYFPPPEEKTKAEIEKEGKDRAVAYLKARMKGEKDPRKLAELQNELTQAVEAAKQAVDQVTAQKTQICEDLGIKISAENDPVKKAVLQVELKKAQDKVDREDALRQKGEAEQEAARIAKEIDDLKKAQTGTGEDNANNPLLAAKQTDLQTAKDTLAKLAQKESAQKKNEADDLTQHPDQPWTYLAHAVYGFFLNGGGACYVVNLGEDENGENIIPLQEGLDRLNRIDEIAILAAPGYQDPTTYMDIQDACDKLGDRVAILDGPDTINRERLSLLGGEEIADTWAMPDKSERGMATMYVPWLMVANPNPKTNKDIRTILVPPSGHVAGIWARSDATYGVHKAPANEAVRGALNLQYRISDTEQSNLNKNGVNCIRYFTGEGNLVWGARTMTKDPLWTYLNVRRLFNQIEESILKSTRWIVFEPNDRPLWQAIRRDVTAFLMTYWRSGALMGKTPEEAFFVKCDDENNPSEEIILGRVHIDIGLAPVRPAEFVIFQIAQYEAGNDVKVSGA